MGVASLDMTTSYHHSGPRTLKICPHNWPESLRLGGALQAYNAIEDKEDAMNRTEQFVIVVLALLIAAGVLFSTGPTLAETLGCDPTVNLFIVACGG